MGGVYRGADALWTEPEPRGGYLGNHGSPPLQAQDGYACHIWHHADVLAWGKNHENNLDACKDSILNNKCSVSFCFTQRPEERPSFYKLCTTISDTMEGEVPPLNWLCHVSHNRALQPSYSEEKHKYNMKRRLLINRRQAFRLEITWTRTAQETHIQHWRIGLHYMNCQPGEKKNWYSFCTNLSVFSINNKNSKKTGVFLLE